MTRSLLEWRPPHRNVGTDGTAGNNVDLMTTCQILGEIIDENSPTTARNGVLMRKPMSNNGSTKAPKEEENQDSNPALIPPAITVSPQGSLLTVSLEKRNLMPRKIDRCLVGRMAESTMQVVYKTCLTRIEREKKVAGKASSPTAYNSIPAPVPPSAPLRPLLAPRGPRRAVCDRTRPRALYPD